MRDITALSNQEYDLFKGLIYSKFGISLGDKKKALVSGRLQNVLRKKGFDDFKQYYDFLLNDQSGEGLSNFINMLSTNHTFFYRESRHFEMLKQVFIPQVQLKSNKKIRIWSAGCSSGEEPYTIAMILDEALEMDISRYHPGILATDISERALGQATTAIYSFENIRNLPEIYVKKYFTELTEGANSLNERIKSQVLYRRLNLMRSIFPFKNRFDCIFCRNVMIYFGDRKRKELIQKFYDFLLPGDTCLSGIPRVLIEKIACLNIYSQQYTARELIRAMKKTRVLIVDDSALVRDLLTRGLSMDKDIEVVGAAGDPYKARDMIIEHHPDVLTLDVEMPRMDGLEFLNKLMPQFPLPVIMISALTSRSSQITLDALAAGAIDFVLKPAADVDRGLQEMIGEVQKKVKMAGHVDVTHWQRNGTCKNPPLKNSSLSKTTDKVVAIGASTGGTEAIRKIITALPPNIPGTVIVQHMPAGFTQMFAERLNKMTELKVKEAKSGDRVMTGHVLIAPGNKQMQLIRSGGEFRVICRDGDLVCGHRPSVDVLFRSVAKYAATNSLAVMLTGMGDDGADAMVKIKQAGGQTIAQDKNSCIVFGMPKEAFLRGGVEVLTSLDNIPLRIIEILAGMSS